MKCKAIDATVIEYLTHLTTKGKRQTKMLIRCVVDLRRCCLKISEIPKYLKADYIEPIERKRWTMLKRREAGPVRYRFL